MKTKGSLIVGCVGWLACGLAAHAQPQFDAPDQFYTNGQLIDGWSRDDANDQIVSLWFGKNPKNSLSYRQLIAIIKDDEPNKVLYYDLVAKRFVGRYDMQSNKYSLLPPQYRLGRLEDLQEHMFPPPGEKPPIGDLFDPPADGQPNDDQLMMPPATMMMPRLENSTWKGFYTDFTGKRQNVVVQFNGQQGEYRVVDGSLRGRLNHVQYIQQPQQNMLMIRGNWSTGGSSGSFTFRIAMDNVGEFTGEWNAGSRGGGIWDCKRTSR